MVTPSAHKKLVVLSLLMCGRRKEIDFISICLGQKEEAVITLSGRVAAVVV